jgi:3-oxoacyl-[acyl-carrier-protein] synthase I
LGTEFHKKSRVIAKGRVAVAAALKHARQLIQELNVKQVMIAAADSLLVAHSLYHLEENERLLTSKNSDGIIPGEAGAAVMVEPVSPKQKNRLLVYGLGFGFETAYVGSGKPLRADGLTSAIKESLNDAGFVMEDLHFRITDISGEQYYFKEANLALLRLLRKRKEEFDIWHPADCIGEVGAAIGLIMIAVLAAACEKDYSKGNRILAHLGNDDGTRCSMIFASQ